MYQQQVVFSLAAWVIPPVSSWANCDLLGYIIIPWNVLITHLQNVLITQKEMSETHGGTGNYD